MDRLRRARLGTWLTFCVTGVVGATWASRIPAVQDRLGLGPGDLAVVVLAIEGGALVGLPLGAAVVARFGSRAALRAGLLVFAPALVAAAAAPGPGSLVIVVFGWAVANSLLDVALNAQGAELARRSGRPVLSGLHSGQSLGTVAGAAAGTAAAALGVPFVWHAVAVALIALAVGLPAASVTLRAAVSGSQPPFVRPGRPLLLLGGIAFCAFLVDGAAMNWIAVHLRSAHGAGEGLAAAGYLAFAMALVVGRLPGDRLAARFSRRRLIEACAAGMAAGTAGVVLAPGPGTALVGWVLVGLALAPVAPAVLGAAPDADCAPAATALAAVTTIGYLGSFLGPPAVGLLAEVGDLSLALVLLGVAATAAGLLARRALPHRRPDDRG